MIANGMKGNYEGTLGTCLPRPHRWGRPHFLSHCLSAPHAGIEKCEDPIAAETWRALAGSHSAPPQEAEAKPPGPAPASAAHEASTG